MLRSHVLTLDLRNDPDLIAAYEEHHRAVWPEVEQSIRVSGIIGMTIYRHETRLVMVIEVNDTFSFARKATLDAANSVVQQWEKLMEHYQETYGAPSGGKWQDMKIIYSLNEEVSAGEPDCCPRSARQRR